MGKVLQSEAKHQQTQRCPWAGASVLREGWGWMVRLCWLDVWWAPRGAGSTELSEGDRLALRETRHCCSVNNAEAQDHELHLREGS